MYNRTGMQEILGVWSSVIDSVSKAFRIKPNEKGLFTLNQMSYLGQCYKLKTSSSLNYEFISKMPTRIIKELIRVNERTDEEINLAKKRAYDKRRYLNRTQ